MSGFNAEHLVGDLLKSGLGGGKKSRKRMKKGLRRAAFSPQGLMLLGGVAVAAFEHFSAKGQAQAAPAPPGAGSGSGSATSGPASSGQATTAGAPSGQPRPAGLPPTPGSSTQSVGTRAGAAGGADRANLPPLPGSSPTSGKPPALPLAAAPGTDKDSFAEATGANRAQALLLAMTEAAKCDGVVSEEERAQIVGDLETLGVGPEARAFMEAQLGRPLDVESLVQAVGGDATLAAQVFVASRVVIADASPAEEGYLALLAARLGIPADLAQQLRAHIDKALEDGEGEG